MVKRAFWITFGATVGILVVTKGTKALRKLTPAALSESAGRLPAALTGAIQDFADDVRAAATEREFELYKVLGVDAKDAGDSASGPPKSGGAPKTGDAER
jgi:hypothetical protein